MLGSRGNDTINVTSNLDNLSNVEVIDGGAGTDTIAGTRGDDVMDLSAGPELRNIERVDGGYGDDTITGTDGDDNIVGNRGDDTLSGGDGDDNLVGGSGNDTFVYDAGVGIGDDFVDGGHGLDEMDLTNAGDWTITFDDGSQVCSDDDPSEAVFSETSGSIDFAGGDKVTFESVESFNW